MTAWGAKGMNVEHFFRAFGYSVKGLRACFRDETAFRQECLLAIPHFIGLLALPLETWVRVYLVLLWVILIVVELLNTAIEAVVNLVSPEHHPLAGKAKDCGSAAVFCILILFFLSWGWVIYELFKRSL